jgi:hypothetical protein
MNYQKMRDAPINTKQEHPTTNFTHFASFRQSDPLT